MSRTRFNYAVERRNERKRRHRVSPYAAYEGSADDWVRLCRRRAAVAFWLKVALAWVAILAMAVAIVFLACKCAALNREAAANMADIERMEAARAANGANIL